MATAQPDYQSFRERITGRRVQPDTADKYTRWVKRFEMWRGDRPPEIGTLIDFDSFLADETITDYPWENLTGRPAPKSYSYSSRRIALSAAKLWLRLNYNEEIIEEVQNIISGEQADFDPKYLSMDDATHIIENAPNDCDCSGCQAALAVTYDAILRAKEMTKIQREDIDFEQNALTVRSVKGSFKSTVSLSPYTMDLLREHIDTHDPGSTVFTNTYGNGWKASSFCSHFRNQHHEVGAHSFGRHSPITHRLQNPTEFHDMNPDDDVFGQVYRRARHRHPDMTIRYARIIGVEIPDWAGE